MGFSQYRSEKKRRSFPRSFYGSYGWTDIQVFKNISTIRFKDIDFSLLIKSKSGGNIFSLINAIKMRWKPGTYDWSKPLLIFKQILMIIN